MFATSPSESYTIQEVDPAPLWQLVDIKYNGGGAFAARLAGCGSEPVIDIKDRKVTLQAYGGELFTFINQQVPQVPVPAALWLFGPGILGLAGMARRSRAA